MKKVGKVHSMKVSGRFFAVVGLFAVVFIVASVLVMNNYLNLYYENRELKQKLKMAAQVIKERKYQSNVLSQYNQLVNELNKTEQGGDAGDEQTKDAEVKVAQPLKKDQPVNEEKKDEQAKPDENAGREKPEAVGPENPPVDAVKLSLVAEKNDSVRFQYSLLNVEEGSKKAVNGHIFIIIDNGQGADPLIASYPVVKFENGLPADYKKGTQFSIKHGKTVKGRIDKVKSPADVKDARVIVFSEDGKLLLNKLISAENG